MRPTKKVPIPWPMLLLNSFLIGVYITFIGSGGIFALAFSEGLDAAFLYLSYVPVIVLVISLLSFLVIAMMIQKMNWHLISIQEQESIVMR